MANDTDMWNDIEEFEKNGEQDKSNDLLEVFQARFGDGDIERANELRKRYIKKWGWIDNYW